MYRRCVLLQAPGVLEMCFKRHGHNACLSTLWVCAGSPGCNVAKAQRQVLSDKRLCDTWGA